MEFVSYRRERPPYPVGRLDYAIDEGLLLMTNDGAKLRAKDLPKPVRNMPKNLST